MKKTAALLFFIKMHAENAGKRFRNIAVSTKITRNLHFPRSLVHAACGKDNNVAGGGGLCLAGHLAG